MISNWLPIIKISGYPGARKVAARQPVLAGAHRYVVTGHYAAVIVLIDVHDLEVEAEVAHDERQHHRQHEVGVRPRVGQTGPQLAGPEHSWVVRVLRERIEQITAEYLLPAAP